MSTLFTRQQYMNKECTRQQYYAQFVTEDTKSYIARSNLTLESPLKEWDALAGRISLPLTKLRAAGEVGARGLPSLCCSVCVAKTAYRMLEEEADREGAQNNGG